jgi:hypothetical protein
MYRAGLGSGLLAGGRDIRPEQIGHQCGNGSNSRSRGGASARLPGELSYVFLRRTIGSKIAALTGGCLPPPGTNLRICLKRCARNKGLGKRAKREEFWNAKKINSG